MENTEGDISPDDNQITKPKKPRSEKQILAFQEVMRKRKENVDKRNEERLIKASEILVKANSNKSNDIPTKPKQKVVIPHVSDDDETDEEIIIVKSKPKPKKKVKKIIIEDSSDSDISIDSDDSKEYNKKSYSKSNRKHQPVSIQREVERPKPIFNSANFFI